MGKRCFMQRNLRRIVLQQVMNTGGVEGLFIKTLLEELKRPVKEVTLQTHSSSGKAAASRRGLGRLRHLRVKELWMQDKVKAGEITIESVKGDAHAADMLTKPLPRGRIWMLA